MAQQVGLGTGILIIIAGLGAIWAGAEYYANTAPVPASRPASSQRSDSFVNQVLDKEFTIELSGAQGIEFSGSYGCVQTDGKNSQRSVEGVTPASYSCKGSIVSAVFQKQSDNSQSLVLSVKSQGKTLDSTSTSAAFGVAQIATD